MKQKETQLNTGDKPDPYGDNHQASGSLTPIRDDAFALDDDTKVKLIEEHFREIMQVLGLDMTDDSLKGTPHRVAHMYVKELFKGLNPAARPSITLFDNKYKFDEMVAIRDVTFHTVCEHHFVSFFGKAHVAYIPKDKVAGLSKINRLVQFYARRPQVQERMTVQIAEDIRHSFGTGDVAVMLEARHMCVASRGIEDAGSSTVTTRFLGAFHDDERLRNQFLSYVNRPSRGE